MHNISDRFIQDLNSGALSFFLEQVKGRPNDFYLAIRGGFINIYYRGGSLLRIEERRDGYAFKFDSNYCLNKRDDSKYQLLSSMPKRDPAPYIKNFDLMTSEMNTWFAAHPKKEREIQHHITISNDSVFDLEYQVGKRMRLDMIAFYNCKLVLIENKFGNGAVSGSAGLAKHYQDMCRVLTDQKLYQELVQSMCSISRVRYLLQIKDQCICPSDITGAEILFLLINYNKRSSSLTNEAFSMKGEIPAQVAFMGINEYRIPYEKAGALA